MKDVKKKKEAARVVIKGMTHCKNWRFMVLNKLVPSPSEYFLTNSLSDRLFKVQVRSKIQGGDVGREVEGFCGGLLHFLRLQTRGRRA